MIGETISHYRILEKLGEGGMGVVYKAEDTALKRIVALKFLPHGLGADESKRARFLQEAQAAAALNHPSICTIYDIGQEGSDQYIVMEYVEGVTLREKIGSGRLQTAECIGYAIQIGEALQEAHSKAIVHRDIKAENIMLNEKNQVKVMDFGLAKLKGSQKLTKTGRVMGTLGYMAPEQIERGESDARSDLFSFGVVLFEMFAGRMPFRGEHEATMVYSIVHEEPEPLEKHRPDVPPPLLSLVRRALEKSPRDRYQSAEEMVIELKRVQHQSAVSVSATQVMSRTHARRSPFPFRKKSVIAGFAVVTIAAIAAVLYVTVLKTRSDRKPPISMQSMSVARLTSDGKVRAAAISPDGKYVVFSSEESGQQSLWVRQVATSSNVQIVRSAEVSYNGLVFSHDGNYVFYTMMMYSTGRSAAYTIPVLGGTPRKILDDVENGLTLSPNSEEFAFTRYYPARGEYTLMVARADGSGEKVIASHQGEFWFNGRPAWSPDGKVLACPLGSYEGGFHNSVVAVELEGAVERHFTRKRWYSVNQLEWLPDGSGLLVGAQERGSSMSQVFQLTYPEGEASRTTNDLLEYSSLSLTDDAQTLCVVQGDYRGNIWILPQGGVSAQQVTNGRDDGVLGVAWTPDGRVVYASSESGTPDLWVIDRDGKNRRQLAADAALDYAPAVAPNGQFILFNSDRSGVDNIWRIDFDGSRPRQLTSERDNYYPSVSPDGAWFVYESWAAGVCLVMKESTEGGEPIRLSQTNGSRPAVSQDGKLIAYIFVDEQTRSRKVEIIPAAGGEQVREFELPHTAGSLVRWSSDGSAIFFIVEARGASNLWSQSLKGGPPKQITDFKSDRINEFDWSPDGKFLAVSRYSVTTDVLLMSDQK